MTIKLVTDSTCDLSPELLKAHNITVVPINIRFGSDVYKENVSIAAPRFYQIIEQTGVLPQTSQPAVGEFIETYKQLVAKPTDEIISIHITGQLSGTHQSAVLAAEKIAPETKVYVIDSMAGSAGLGWMLVEASQLAKQGKPATEIKTYLEQKRSDVSVYFAVDNLKFAEMSGRVGKLAAVLNSILKIKPVIGLENGLLSVQNKTRSTKRALQQIVTSTKEKVGATPVNIGVVHAQAPELGESLLHLACAELNVKNAFAKDLALSLAVHFGPGTVGLNAYPVSE